MSLLLLATAVGVTLATVPDSNSDELARLEMEPVDLTLPSGETRTVLRGMLRVPIVRADPESKEIGVDVWLFPADPEVPDGRLPVFRLNGGPGWPGHEPEGIDWADDIAPFVAHGDLVVVGQRGIGTSEPNTSCVRFSMRIDPDLAPEEAAAAMHAQCTACREHWEGEGYDLSGFNVIEAAGDVNDVRRLLGYDQIVVMGSSFGSHWGMTVMRYHPEIVARALLSGMEGPDHTYDSPSGVLGALERISEEAEASPQLTDRIPEEGLVEALRFVIQSLEENPFELELSGENVPITAEGLRDVALGYENRVNSRQSVAGWPKDVLRLYEGDFEGLGRAIARKRMGGAFLPTASFFQLDCGSGITRARLDEYQNDPATEIVGDLAFFYESACTAWNADLGDDFRADFSSPIPTVVVHGTWDVSTPFDNALELVPCFQKLHFIPVSRGTHGALWEAIRNDPGFGEAIMAFLFEGETDGLPEELELPPIDWIGTW